MNKLLLIRFLQYVKAGREEKAKQCITIVTGDRDQAEIIYNHIKKVRESA